ncbi:3-dehydroquinate synthase [Candidatus Woesearchaeota archaeon]|nr:3-dehydroquinate synthase [Candidatus Woesearchaeota archaeon]
MVTLKDNVMRINLKREVDNSYDVIAGDGMLDQLREDLEQKRFGSKVAIVVSQYFNSPFSIDDLKPKGVDVRVYEDTFENSAIQALAIIGDMSKNDFGRDSVVLSVGNNDLAGFVAAYFNRGINLLAIQRNDFVEQDFHIRCSNSNVGIKANKIPKRVYNLSGERNRYVELKKLVDDSYDIVFTGNLFEKVAYELAQCSLFSRHSRYAIITDSNVRKYQAGKLEEEIKSRGLDTKIFSFEAGEPNKTFETCERVIQDITEFGYADCLILALGGGVVGDMAGFIAEMTDVPYIQIPTTVLAQADSSVGGKTAVDTKYGKNLIGAFRQPNGVYISTWPFETLDERQYRSGFAEVIKHGIIKDGIFSTFLNANVDRVLRRDQEILRKIAEFNCRVKGNVVEEDPHEKGLRRILNYGHTLGHAIEKISIERFQKGLSDDYLLHGEAVSIGMALAGDIATNYGYPREHLELQNKLLVKFGLPIKIPEGITNDDIMKVTTTDKKAKNGKARYTLPIANGEMNTFDGAYATYVENDVVMKALNETR